LINDAGGTEEHSYTPVQVRPDTIRFGFYTTVTEDSNLFGTEWQFKIKFTCTFWSTPLSYMLSFATGGTPMPQIKIWNYGNPDAEHPGDGNVGFDWTTGPLVQQSSWGKTADDDNSNREFQIRSSPGLFQTGTFTTAGYIYITSAELIARSATLQPGYLYNVCIG
jgi:hypothetical protein